MLDERVSNGNTNIPESEHGLRVSQAVNFYRLAFGVGGRVDLGLGLLELNCSNVLFSD